MQLLIKPSERVFIAGRTGTGKTYLAKYLLKDANRLVVFDGKGTLKDWNTKDWNDQTKRELQKGNDTRIRVRVPIGTPKQIIDELDETFKQIYLAENCIVYLDEIFSIASAFTIPPYLIALYTRGRELDLGVWTATQRPSNIPLFAMSEADWYIMFRLQMATDIEKMSKQMGAKVLKRKPVKHDFWVYNNSWNEPSYVKNR